MPGYDRSGPEGAGPMTGGGRGFCSRKPATGVFGSAGRGGGRGWRRGVRAGFGRQRFVASRFTEAGSAGDPIRSLQATTEALAEAIERIEQRLDQKDSSRND